MNQLISQALLLNAFICFVGLALHFSMKWAEARNVIPNKEARPGLGEYLSDVPAQSMIAVLGTVGVFTVMTAMEWMNPGMAFASGYMGNSMAENLANRFSNPSK